MREQPIVRKMVLELDLLDYEAIQDAIAKRQTWRDEDGLIVPDSDSNTAGLMIAEICRGWLEMMQSRD